MKDIEAIIKGIDRLDPIPQVANKVMSILEDPDSSVSELAEVIKYDPSLTANILKICNSAYFGLSREINSVQHAVNMLGMKQVADLVLMSSVSRNLKKEQEGYDLKEGELWRYSVSSALLARDLAERKGQKNNHFVFTAALLKDIGKLVLNQYVAESYEKINALVNKEGLSFREAEKEVIGIDHAELGGVVADRWKFSDRMVNIIRNHHLSEDTSASDFEISIVYLADIMCMMMGIGVGCDGLAYRFYQDTIERVGFSQKDFQEIMAGFGEKLHQVEELVSFA